MSAHEFTIKTTELDAGGKDYTMAVRPAWVRGALEDSEAKATPVIMVTNSVNRSEMVQCYQSHAGGYIPKSFNFEVFKAHISNTIHYWAKCVALPTRTTSRSSVGGSPV